MSSRTRIFKTEAGDDVYGVMAEYANPADLAHAAEKVRDAGYRKWDVYSPFPVHGMEESMGLTPTRLPLLVGVLGLSGAVLGMLFQIWVGTEGFRTVVQGKPYGAWQPFIPVTFEFGVIFTAFSALIGMLAFNGLPRWHHPLLTKERFLRCSDDKFVIAVEAADEKFEPEATRRLLQLAGAVSIELVEDKKERKAAAADHH
ncbi:MAG: DUF3341 domain-containing protein [Phycisphaerales bacterium]